MPLVKSCAGSRARSKKTKKYYCRKGNVVQTRICKGKKIKVCVRKGRWYKGEKILGPWPESKSSILRRERAARRAIKKQARAAMKAAKKGDFII